MVTVRDITRRFGTVEAVRDVSFIVNRGQVVGVLGPNGAGKTTTIRMIAGLLPPTRGSVSVAGADTVAESRSVRRRIGYLPEQNPLYPEMTPREFLRFRCGVFGIPRREGKSAIDRAAGRCGLQDVMTQRIGTLSKGYRQRVGLAAALLHNPELLILDEPTSGLDPVQIAEVRSLIREIGGEKTVLLVSHILPEVEKTCDRLLIFSGGRLRADGSASELVSKHGRSDAIRVSARARDGGSLDAGVLERVPGVRAVEGVAHEDGWLVCTLRTQNDADALSAHVGEALLTQNAVVRRLEPVRLSLEELYIRLVEPAAENTAAEHAGATSDETIGGAA